MDIWKPILQDRSQRLSQVNSQKSPYTGAKYDDQLLIKDAIWPAAL